jgi:hypothetical protein
MFFCFGKPIPKKPIMADYHSEPSSVVSDKIYNVLNDLNIKGLQLIPATIRGNKKEEYPNYWFLHITNFISEIFDKEKSVFRLNNLVFRNI